MFTLYISTLIVFVITFLLAVYWQKTNYWKRRNVESPFHIPFISMFTNFYYAWIFTDKNYKRFKSKRYWGEYESYKPRLVVCDPILIRDILVKEASHFIDRKPITLYDHEAILNETVGMMSGEKWKSLRSILSPAFTSGKIKAMYPLVESKCTELVNHLQTEMEKNGFVEMKSSFTYFSCDVISECVFGINSKCQKEQAKSTFLQNGLKFFSISLKNILKLTVISVIPFLEKHLKVYFFNGAQFFIDIGESSIQQRQQSGVSRGDFIDLLLDALEKSKKDENYKYPMTVNTIIANMALLLGAGFETVSNALSFTTHLLASNPQCQKLLRKELQNIIQKDGELNYQNVMEAEYLEACFSETLRLYPLSHMMERSCTQKYKIPDSDIEIPEGMMIGIPMWSIQRDAEYWENPDSFQPDRFLPQNKSNITPFAYMPFGHGPRNCLGMRFAQFESKLAIAKVCVNFEMKMRPGHETVKMDAWPGLLTTNKDGVQIILTKIDELSS